LLVIDGNDEVFDLSARLVHHGRISDECMSDLVTPEQCITFFASGIAPYGEKLLSENQHCIVIGIG
jgi:hypothetical protein